MARKVYLVDTENVGTAWKELLPQRGVKDAVILFYTEHSPGISYADLNAIREYPSSFDMVLCYPGKNGLDFQMVSYLGYLIKTAPRTEYVIISNDTGYDAAVKFWRSREIEVCRKGRAELTVPQDKQESDDVKVMLKQLLTEGSSADEDLERIFQVLRSYSVKQLQELYYALQKEFGAAPGMDIYRQLKPQIKKIYKMLPNQ